MRNWKQRTAPLLIGLQALMGSSWPAHAAVSYQSGYVNNVTFVREDVFIQLDTGLPDNCAGTSYG
jgi:hypothetical protein